MIRKVVTGALLAGVLVFGYLAFRSFNPPGPPAVTKDSLGAPVASVRRTPSLLASIAAGAQVRAQLNQIIDETKFDAAGGRYCIKVMRNNVPVIDSGPEISLIPASTLKLVTSSAALDTLGPNARFTTAVKADSSPKNGVVKGPLYLIGGGDPLLFTADYASSLKDRKDIHTPLEALADSVVAKGVKSIQGGVVGDDTYFDNKRSVQGWDPGYARDGQVGPIGALLVNQGLARPKESAPIADPATDAATRFAALLKARGVTVAKPASSGITPSDSSDIAKIASPPLGDVMNEMLTNSDNTTAEMLTKDIAAQASKDSVAKGSWPGGLQKIATSTARSGITSTGLTMFDGSGLARADRATCSVLESTLGVNGFNGPIADGLPRAGETGTLRTRMNNTEAVGRVRAKTGTLNDVSAMAGWAQTKSGDQISFTTIENGFSSDLGRKFEDRLAVLLASLPPLPDSIAYAPDTK